MMSSSPATAVRLMSSDSEFEIIVTEAEIKNKISDRNVAVLLFGFAGSSYKQLEKHSVLYNSLGYKTLHCILPIRHIFHYDVPRIISCSQKVCLKNIESPKKNFLGIYCGTTGVPNKL